MNTIIKVTSNDNNNTISVRKPTLGKEIEMVYRFIEYKQEIFEPTPQNYLMIFVEPLINNSYPDIVFVEYNPEKFNNWSKIRNELNKIDYKVLYNIYINKKTNADDIVARIGTSWKETMQAIEKLYDSKLIYRELGQWVTIDNYLFGANKIEVVEAKINKIEHVYKQALLNQIFASESYILLNRRIRNENNEHFGNIKKAGIGIYTESCCDKKFHKALKSNKKEIPSSLNSLLVNEWIGKVLYSYKQGEMQ